MADIFGRNIRYGGGFLPEGTSVKFAGITGGAIVRNIQIAYEQPVSRIWDLGSGRCFFVAGHPNGSWSMGKIGGPGASIKALGGYNVCNPGTVTFAGENGMCSPAGEVTYTLKTVITTSINVAVSSEDMIINEGVGGTFMSLEAK
jgi:hypothetical protein